VKGSAERRAASATSPSGRSRKRSSAAVIARGSVGFTIDPILTAILIVQAMTFSQISACWLNWGWMRLLGRMSYSIYLYQQVTLSPPRHLLKSAPLLVQLIAGIATCLAFSAASYYFVERPFQTLKERIGTRAKKQAVEVDPSAATS